MWAVVLNIFGEVFRDPILSRFLTWKAKLELVTVVIPVFERSQMLLRAVRSVLAQRMTNFELLVVDDGSRTLSAEVSALLEPPHRVIRIPRSGVAAARNRGMKEARSRWIAFLDSDDSWRPDKLEQQIFLHQRTPDLLLSQCEEVWHRNGQPVTKAAGHEMASGEDFERSLNRCLVSASSIMLDRELLLRYGGFDERLVVCEDYDLWIRLLRLHRIGFLPEPLVLKFGGRDDQLSKALPAMDRFRVFSFLKMLLYDTLSQRERNLICAALSEKAQVLYAGAKRRGFATELRYQTLIELVREPSKITDEFASSTVLWGIFRKLEDEILSEKHSLLSSSFKHS